MDPLDECKRFLLIVIVCVIKKKKNMTSHLTENKKNKNYKTTSTPGLLKCVFFYGGRSDIKKNKKKNAEVDGVMLLGQVTASKQAKKQGLTQFLSLRTSS